MSPISLLPQETSLVFLTLILFFPLIITIFILTKHLFSKSPPLPPGPLPWPILGNIPQLIIWRGETLQALSSRLSKAYRSDLVSLKLGAKRVVIATTREAAEEVLRAHDRNLSARHVPDVLHAGRPELNNFSLGWTLECNDSWKSLRTTCRSELFSSRALQSQEGIREKRVEEMVGIVEKMKGREVSVRNVAFATIYNIMSNVLVSRDLLNMEDEICCGKIGGLIKRSMEIQSTPNISDLYPFLGFLDLQKLRKWSIDMYHMANKGWEAIVKERKERINSSIQQDFLDVLIKDGSSDDQIYMLLSELLIAGTDSTALTVEWTMAELVKNPKCMIMVQQEVRREIQSQELSKVSVQSILPKLKYLEACVKEALRLHPPGPLLIPRRAAKPCTVMSYKIPKNTTIFINVWAIGRDPRNWEDPLEFKPERFLSESTLDFKGNDFEFLPFGGGRRICPGLTMASKLMVPLIIASLLNAFDWSLSGQESPEVLDMSEGYDILLRKKEPLVLVPSAKIIN